MFGLSIQRVSSKQPLVLSSLAQKQQPKMISWIPGGLWHPCTWLHFVGTDCTLLWLTGAQMLLHTSWFTRLFGNISALLLKALSSPVLFGDLKPIARCSKPNLFQACGGFQSMGVPQTIQVLRPWLTIATHGDLGIPHFTRPKYSQVKKSDRSGIRAASSARLPQEFLGQRLRGARGRHLMGFWSQGRSSSHHGLQY